MTARPRSPRFGRSARRRYALDAPGEPAAVAAPLIAQQRNERSAWPPTADGMQHRLDFARACRAPFPCLRGELTGSRWKVRYAARCAAIRPGGRTGRVGSPASGHRDDRNSAIRLRGGYGSRSRGAAAPPPLGGRSQDPGGRPAGHPDSAGAPDGSALLRRALRRSAARGGRRPRRRCPLALRGGLGLVFLARLLGAIARAEPRAPRPRPGRAPRLARRPWPRRRPRRRRPGSGSASSSASGSGSGSGDSHSSVTSGSAVSAADASGSAASTIASSSSSGSGIAFISSVTGPASSGGRNGVRFHGDGLAGRGRRRFRRRCRRDLGDRLQPERLRGGAEEPRPRRLPSGAEATTPASPAATSSSSKRLSAGMERTIGAPPDSLAAWTWVSTERSRSLRARRSGIGRGHRPRARGRGRPAWRSAHARASGSRRRPRRSARAAYVHDSADLDAAPALVERGRGGPRPDRRARHQHRRPAAGADSARLHARAVGGGLPGARARADGADPARGPARACASAASAGS